MDEDVRWPILTLGPVDCWSDCRRRDDPNRSHRGSPADANGGNGAYRRDDCGVTRSLNLQGAWDRALGHGRDCSHDCSLAGRQR